MNAWVLRGAVFALLAAAIAWAWHWAALGAGGVAVAGAVAIVLAHLWVLAIEFPLMHWANRDDPSPRATWREVVSAWWHETWIGLRVFAWEQPFRVNAVPDHLPSDAHGKRGVVLVHGFLCNRGMWNGWMRRLRAQGVPFVAVNLEPTFGSIEGYAVTVGDAVQRMRTATGRAPVIACHSMGGLATRGWVRTLAGLAAEARSAFDVHAFITLGTPHRGTSIGRFNPAPNVIEMRFESPWVTALGEGEAPQLRARFTCFYSHCDNIVFPASCATLPGADNHHIRATGHMQLIDREDVFATLLAKLAEGD